MKYFIYTLAVLFLMSSCNKGDKNSASAAEGNAEGANTEQTSAARTSLPDNFYLKLSGTIKDKPIVMELTRHDSTLNGTYYYVSQGKNLNLYGTINKSGKVSMNESVGYTESTGTLTGNFSPDGSFSGTWAGNGKSFPVALKETYENGAVKAEMKIWSESVKVKNAEANVLISYPVISLANASAQDAINKAIMEKGMLDGESEEGKSAKKATTVEESMKQCLAGYKSMLVEMTGEGGMDMEGRGVGEESSQYISLNENGILAITEAGYMDGGGAHPNSFTSFENYNTATGAKISLMDILQSNYKSGLYPIAEKLFYKQTGLAKDELEWGEKGKFYLPEENFLIQKEGLLFSYGQYEIGAYALGMPSVLISYSDLKPFMKAGNPLSAFAN
jgi:hypothetical protein